MDTPILDFARAYAGSGMIRAHMPGHKGLRGLGPEALDLTEIAGADSLYEADGIIAQSEENAARLFGSRLTLYSCEGSSLCIRAMLAAALRAGRERGAAPVLLAGRNAHRTVLSAACLLGFEISWLYGSGDNVLSVLPGPEEIRAALSRRPEKPFAVFLTSPDYLGGMADIGAAAKVCAEYGVPLLVDNAHGAYLRFLDPPLHPLALGAQMCCDSAHKTLPALTGAAYLHVGDMPGVTARGLRECMALFGSTSPSYLILSSLDRLNGELAGDYSARLRAFCKQLRTVREALKSAGWTLYGAEPMKLTLHASRAGWRGDALAARLRALGIECEFADPDFAVLMTAPGQEDQLPLIGRAILSLPVRDALPSGPPAVTPGERALSVRAAMLAPAEEVPAEQALGRVLAAPCVSCPPAVPLLVCGERVTQRAIDAFRYYGIRTLSVVRKENE